MEDDLKKLTLSPERHVAGPSNRPVSSDVKTAVTIQKAVSPGEFYLTLNELDGDYVKLNDNLQKYCSGSEPKTKRRWEVDDECAVNVGDKWRRGVVVEEPYVERELLEWKVTVKLLDEIGEVSAAADSLVVLPLKFRRLIGRVSQCCLGGIQPIGSWTRATTEFDDFVRSTNLFIKQIRNAPDDDISIKRVELFNAKWDSLNEQLCSKGFAKVLTNQTKLNVEPFRNVMEDEKQVVAYLMQQTQTGDVGRKRDAHKPKTRWFPAEPLKSNAVSGKVTYVGENCDIYVQICDSRTRDTLNAIIHEIGLCEPVNADDWEVNDICLVRYDLDGKWYRGEILRTDYYNHYVVKFVDYGNVEYVMKEDLRKVAGLTMRPLQVHTCYFDNLLPITLRWEKLQVELVHLLLVDKICQIELRRLRSGFLGIAKMCLPDGRDALEVIVSRGLGRYINTSVQPTVWCNTGKVGKFWKDVGRYKLLQIPKHVNTFYVEIPAILSPDIFILKICHSDDPELKKQMADFVNMQVTLQEAHNQPECTASDKACVSNYDGVWYRCVLSSTTVQYVDYGNVEEKRPEDVKRMKDSWYSVPCQALPSRIHGYKYSGKFPLPETLQALQRRFSSRTTIATVMHRGRDMLDVELRDECGSLLYQDFVDIGLYVPR